MSSVPPPSFAAPGVVPGIPGLGGDVAPPAFVQQQQAAAEAARRAQAAAADPFSAASHAPVGPQEVRLVIDEKAVADHEVGRKSTGTFIAIGVTALVALGGGYALGGLMQSRSEERQTVQAMGAVRTAVSNLNDVISAARSHLQTAAERGNIQVVRGGDDDSAPAAAQHPPDVDEELITWFQGQPPEPPFGAEIYAGRVGRLRSEIVSKLTLVTIQTAELWRQLGNHVRVTRVADTRAAIQAMNPQNPTNQELSRLLVVFARSPQGATFAQLVSPTGPPNPLGAIPVGGPGITGNATRTAYGGAAIQPADLLTIAFPLANQGIPAQYHGSAVVPWQQYSQRIRDMKQLADALATSHQQLTDALAGRRGH